ncbi:hypothetical protein PMNALOAF_4101 [Methylobacterium adhaesivum]|uniref:Uncharacterized protein n=1 Tax=Methylobacterium adhaesivum TaxID=333297 RepID=A0ABT8BMN0_9HYPH|nr:hypothetical protein [Methylobacterium adhaesivum]MDN3592479.1 hypothetical protein [Methylobacterium adhaesivum]GJD32822.1 hypothetical protein PMNALOAF_4101 [Methylobacterium adhaesivum]
MPREPLIIGEMIHHTPEGDIAEPMALATQRREAKRGKYTFLVVQCPLCGELHEHSDGDGSRVPHCAGRKPFSGEYYVIGADQHAVPATTPYPKLKKPLKRAA